MAKPPRTSDFLAVLKGLQSVGSAAAEAKSLEISRTWRSSSLKPLVMQSISSIEESIKNLSTQQEVRSYFYSILK